MTLANASTPPRFVLLGGFGMVVGGGTLDVQKQKLAVLAVLVIAAPQRLSRGRLRGLLWSDSPEANAQNSLRNALSLLRQTLADRNYDGLCASRDEVWLTPGSYTTDIDDLRAALSRGTVPRALFAGQGFPGTILQDLAGSDLFQETLTAFRRKVVDDLAAEAEAALLRQTGPARIALLEFLTDLLPDNEAHHRALIAALAQDGRKADALATYQRLWTRLDTEFGEEPAPETQDLVVALKQAAVPDPGLDRPVILVRLDTDAAPSGGDPGRQGRLADLRNLVLSALGRFREWRVIDARYMPDPGQIKAQSRGLLCSLTLVASTAQDDGAERILAILTDMRTGQIIWSDPLGDDRQITPGGLDTAVRRFATAINLLFSGPGRPVSDDGPTAHYDLWIEAQQKLRDFTVAGWHEAEVALDRILAENPRHVRALSARASIETMRQIAFPGVMPAPHLHRRALIWASEASLADPMDSRAQLALAWACAMSRQFDRAIIAYELAFQHNENDPWTIASALVGFVFCEAPDRARALVNYLDKLGLALEPFHWSYLAAASFLMGDDAACILQSERAREVSCDVPAWHAAALAHSGRLNEARTVAGRFIDLTRAQWTLPTRPSEAEIMGWILSCFPIRAPQRWTRLRTGLELAGLTPPRLAPTTD
jgi:DNA-binding SARP family transcriptional activator